MNVLEHIRDDRRALAAMHERLNKDGTLLLLVPAHASLVSPFDRAVGHARRYTRDALAAALHDAGFTVDVLRFVNPIGAVAWFVRSQRTLSASAGAHCRRPKPTIKIEEPSSKSLCRRHLALAGRDSEHRE